MLTGSEGPRLFAPTRPGVRRRGVLISSVRRLGEKLPGLSTQTRGAISLDPNAGGMLFNYLVS